METNILNELRELDRSKVNHLLTDRLGEGTQMLAYSVAYIISKCSGRLPEIFDAFLSEYDIKSQLSPILYNETHDKWEQLNSLASSYPNKEFMAFLLFENLSARRSRLEATPAGLCKLASKVLKIDGNQSIADLCTGTGNFIRECIADGGHGTFFGNDTDENNRIIAMMRADILGDNINISSEDTFRVARSFDRIICNIPFGRKWREFDRTHEGNDAADWLFAKRCISLLEDNGKAVCIVTNGCTWNLSDIKMRKEFVDAGYIEAIIALPNNMFEFSSIGTSLIVLSKGNKDIAFVDATNICTPSRRTNTFTDKDISAILDKLNNCKHIPLSHVAAENYDLYPRTYTNKMQFEENAVPFESLIKRITRGAQISSADLDKLVCSEQTNTRLLMLSNMNSGVISEDLPYISELNKRYEKYCAKHGNLILTKNGYPVKTAIVTDDDATKLLVNGNLYLIELDVSKVYPYYIKAYLDSQHGQEQLRGICVGATILNIPIEALKKLMIPLRSRNEQAEIARDYKRRQQRVLRLRQELSEAENELTRYF